MTCPIHLHLPRITMIPMLSHLQHISRSLLEMVWVQNICEGFVTKFLCGRLIALADHFLSFTSVLNRKKGRLEKGVVYLEPTGRTVLPWPLHIAEHPQRFPLFVQPAMDIFSRFAAQVLELFSHEEVFSLNLHWLYIGSFPGHDRCFVEVNVKPHLVSVFAYSAALLVYVTVGERQQWYVICKNKIKKRFHLISAEMIFCGVAHQLINSSADIRQHPSCYASSKALWSLYCQCTAAYTAVCPTQWYSLGLFKRSSTLTVFRLRLNSH